jgi:plastocyanin
MGAILEMKRYNRFGNVGRGCLSMRIGFSSSAWIVGCLIWGCANTGVETTVKKTPTPNPPAASVEPVSDKPVKEATVFLRNNRFEPAELVLMQGGRINFINQDTRTHSVTPVDGAQFLEVSTLSPGSPSGPISFFSQGDHPFRSRFSENMTGVVRVRYASGPDGTDGVLPSSAPTSTPSAAPEAQASLAPSTPPSSLTLSPTPSSSSTP